MYILLISTTSLWPRDFNVSHTVFYFWCVVLDRHEVHQLTRANTAPVVPPFDSRKHFTESQSKFGIALLRGSECQSNHVTGRYLMRTSEVMIVHDHTARSCKEDGTVQKWCGLGQITHQNSLRTCFVLVAHLCMKVSHVISGVQHWPLLSPSTGVTIFVTWFNRTFSDK